MKRKLKNTVAATMAAAALTTALVGCGSGEENSQTTPAPTANTNSQSNEVNALSAEEEEDSGSNFKKYWNDNPKQQDLRQAALAEARKDATPVEGKMLYDLFQVYTDKDGNEFIISNTTRAYLVNGELSEADKRSLRREETGEKVYFSSIPKRVDDVKQYIATFNDIAGEQADYESRKQLKDWDESKQQLAEQAKTLRINNFQPTLATGLDSGYISLRGLLKDMEKFGFVDNLVIDFDEEDTYIYSGSVAAVGKIFDFEIKVSTDTCLITSAVADGKEFKPQQMRTRVSENGKSSNILFNQIMISLQDIEDIFGWNIELYPDSDNPVVNIVTDNKDLVVPENLVVNGVVKQEELVPPTEPIMPPENIIEGAPRSYIEGYLEQGYSEEEAIELAKKEYAEARAEVQAIWDDEEQRIEEEKEQLKKDMDALHMKYFGMTCKEFDALSLDEKSELLLSDVENKLAYEKEFQEIASKYQ